MGFGWREGLTWTTGHFEYKPLHDWARKHAEDVYYPGESEPMSREEGHVDYWIIYVHGGPFLFIRSFLGITLYIGMRPTSPDPPGVPLEPWPGFFSRFLKRHGMGNFGIALRRAK